MVLKMSRNQETTHKLKKKSKTKQLQNTTNIQTPKINSSKPNNTGLIIFMYSLLEPINDIHSDNTNTSFSDQNFCN